MGTPPQPPAPSSAPQSGAQPAPGADPPAPPAPSQNGSQGGTPPATGEPDELSVVQGRLAAERRAHQATQRALAEAQAATMSDAERQIAEAKTAGRVEAIREAGLRVAAAEFRAAAQGKLADPAAALEVLDLRGFVDDAGEVDVKGITALVVKLAKSLPAPSAGHMPAGPRGGDPEGGGDFLRNVLGRR